MIVERVETVRYALPFLDPYETARGVITEREMLLLLLHTDSGEIAMGEAVPMSLRGDKPIEEVEKRLADAAMRIVGIDVEPPGDDPLSYAIPTLLELSAPRRIGMAAFAALECAVFDVYAKAAGLPLWKMLGASGARPVHCNATLTSAEPSDVAAQARDWAAEGFRTFKLKLGAGYDDVATVEAVRAALGSKAAIRIDANETWSPGDAAAVLREIEEFGIELAEQPTSGLRGLARVAGETSIPIAADESVEGVADAHRALQRRSCAYATAKLAKVGGIGAATQIAKVIPTYLSSALDGPVGIAAAAHAAQVLGELPGAPAIAHGLATQRLFGATPASRECELRSGDLHLPDGTGLGVRLDTDALASLAK